MTSTISPLIALGAGCYWGTEKYVKVDFQKLFPGSIKQAKVGFMSPDSNHKVDPDYRDVCTGQTGHVEVLFVELSRPTEHLSELVKFFFMFHDPTTLNRQGNDVGTQYQSCIFVTDEQQKNIVTNIKNELQNALDSGKIQPFPYIGKQIVTEICNYTTFYKAHDEHQEYLMKNPNGYCNHRYRFRQWNFKN